MCTVSWRRAHDSLDLFFNRDERRTRSAALPPRVFESHQGRLMYATDQESGGTWLAVNDYGCVACVLNFYGATPNARHGSRANRVSRGELPLRAVRVAAPSDASSLFSSCDLAAFDPFILLVLRSGHEGWRLEWDGDTDRHSILTSDAGMETTSSYRTQDVQAFRRAAWEKTHAQALSLDPVIDLHTHFLPDRPEWGCCMSRSDASTVSMTHVSHRLQEIVMSYHVVHDGIVQSPFLQRMDAR